MSERFDHKINENPNEVRQISIIADDVDEICNEIKTFSKAYNYVITSGGIGPTHDDVTFEGIKITSRTYRISVVCSCGKSFWCPGSPQWSVAGTL